MKRGAALPAVLFAIAITSALAVGGAYIARQQAAVARLSARATSLTPAAEAALVSAIVSWDSAARAEQPVGTTQSVAASTLPSLASQVWITRASTGVYWLVAESATSQRPALKSRIGVLIQASEGAPRLAPVRPWADLP
jgi:hypothetical protein